jgi:hypothetical protein
LEPHRDRTGDNWTFKKDNFIAGVNIFRLAKMDCTPARTAAKFARIGGGTAAPTAVRPFPSLCPMAFG